MTAMPSTVTGAVPDACSRTASLATIQAAARVVAATPPIPLALVMKTLRRANSLSRVPWPRVLMYQRLEASALSAKARKRPSGKRFKY